MFSKEQIEILNEELNSNRIKIREKGNIKLSYIEGFDVIDTANKIFGYSNWSYNVSSLEKVSEEKNQNDNYIICYKAIVKISVYNENHTQFITREDVGFGTGIARTLADAYEGGAKESITDSIKRNFRSFGNQFGNSLYDKSRNHNQSNQSHTQNHTQPPVNNHQPQTYNQTNKPPQNTTAYQYQQDFNQLTNLGLTVVQKGDSLIVVGDNVFANKDTIKSNGFRWDGPSKTWYMPLRQAA